MPKCQYNPIEPSTPEIIAFKAGETKHFKNNTVFKNPDIPMVAPRGCILVAERDQKEVRVKCIEGSKGDTVITPRDLGFDENSGNEVLIGSPLEVSGNTIIVLPKEGPLTLVQGKISFPWLQGPIHTEPGYHFELSKHNNMYDLRVVMGKDGLQQVDSLE